MQYTLRVYVKHEGLLVFGAGESVSFPIRVLSPPKTTPSKEPWRVPDNWNPVACSEEPAYIYLQDQD